METIRMPGRLLFATVGGMVIALAPLGAVLIAPSIDPAQAVAQGCSDSETEDSYSLQCVPSQVPDSDQLTEAEVAEPGFNSHPGGGGGAVGGGGGGGGGGHR
jgi:hypothetical protein